MLLGRPPALHFRPIVFAISFLLLLSEGLAGQPVQHDSNRKSSATPGPSQREEGTRTWTDITGKHQTEARALACENGNVRLRKANGQEITVAVEKLSRPDQQYVRAHFQSFAPSPNNTPPKNTDRKTEVQAAERQAELPRGAVTEKAARETRALILVDTRLHALLAPLLSQYARAAGERRGFEIAVEAVAGLDDMACDTVRERVRDLRANHPGLSGILFVGNVRLPSFYSPRGDNTQTRYLPHYYQDLDLAVQQRLAPTDPPQEATDSQPRIPAHDYDWLDRGEEPGVELWAAFLPVGLADTTRDSYEAWALQLSPFFHKAIDYYTHRPTPARRLYKVSNQLWNLGPAWAYYGPERIDFYATNPLEKGSVAPGTPAEQFCRLPAEEAYARAPMERFPTWEDFQAWYGQREWMGEGWQKDTIFLQHMNETAFDAAWVNVHSCENFSLINSDQARSIRQGARMMLLSGCGVGGFRQPGNPSFVDSGVAPEQNILCAYVYGESRALAALGDPFNRGHESYYERMLEWMIQGDYLGQAHLKRLQLQYDNTPNPDELKENVMEMLIGDPFVDLQ